MSSVPHTVIADGPHSSSTAAFEATDRSGSTGAPSIPYRADIDGLRAVAILLVVLYHAGLPGVTGGYVGVDVFFVLSGFLITSVIVQQSTSSKFSLVGFYAGRARRLLPQSLLTLVATVAFGLWLLPPMRATELLADARSAVLYVANWRYADKAVAYVDTEVSDSLLVHYWSLSLEEQFYFVWPLLVVGATLVQRRLRLTSLRMVVFTLAMVITVTSLALSVWWTGDEGSRAYYLTHLRLWEMSAGAAVAMRPRRTPRADRPRPIAQVICLAAICAAALRYDDLTPFPGAAAAVPVFATTVLLGVGGRSSRVDRIVGSRPMTYIGMRSFAWYLWHWPALGFVRLLDDRYGLGLGEVTLAGTALVASFVVADLTHRMVENPIRFAPSLKSLRWTVVLATAAAMATLTAASTVAESRVTEQVAAAWSEAPVSPDDAVSDTASSEFMACHRGFAQDARASTAEWCEAGDPNSDTTIALIGDSHAQHWAPALDAAGRRNGWRVLISTRSSCLVYGAPIFNARLEVMDDGCLKWGRSAEELIEAEGGVDVVVLARARAYFNAVRTDDGAKGTDLEVAASVTDGLGEFLTRLQDDVGRVVLLEDTPWAGYNVPGCLAEETPRTADGCDFEAVETPVETKLLAAEAAAIAAGPPGMASIESWDELVCPREFCDVVQPDGMFVYRDQHHLTASFSRFVGDDLGEMLRDLVALGVERRG